MDEPALLRDTENVDVPLASNPLWDDVQPIPQNDGSHTGKLNALLTRVL